MKNSTFIKKHKKLSLIQMGLGAVAIFGNVSAYLIVNSLQGEEYLIAKDSFLVHPLIIAFGGLLLLFSGILLNLLKEIGRKLSIVAWTVLSIITIIQSTLNALSTPNKAGIIGTIILIAIFIFIASMAIKFLTSKQNLNRYQ